jgi:2-polyprenyl-6-hydroxyphenyl methylase / 3-demethylubiquinone-9 3-methyltransferase
MQNQACGKKLINIDPNEIEKFDKISDRWWDLSGDMKSLHDINPLRVGYIRSRRSLDGLKILDVGCGGGILSEALALAGAYVTGIDMAIFPLRSAAAHLNISGLNIDYRQSTVENWAKNNPNAYDVVTCMELIEHVPDPCSVVTACAGVVKPGGDIFFATINRTLKAFIYIILGGEYILKILPRNTHQYGRFIKSSEMDRWAKQAGLTRMDFTGMHYNLVTKKYWLGGDLSVNYLMHFTKPI